MYRRNKIIFHTARGYLTGIDHRDLTLNQLKKWGVNYHEIVFGKPAADYYIDDKAEDIFDWLKFDNGKLLRFYKELIVLEVANNHQGDMDHAKEIINTYADVIKNFKINLILK